VFGALFLRAVKPLEFSLLLAELLDYALHRGGHEGRWVFRVTRGFGWGAFVSVLLPDEPPPQILHEKNPCAEDEESDHNSDAQEPGRLHLRLSKHYSEKHDRSSWSAQRRETLHEGRLQQEDDEQSCDAQKGAQGELVLAREHAAQRRDGP